MKQPDHIHPPSRSPFRALLTRTDWARALGVRAIWVRALASLLLSLAGLLLGWHLKEAGHPRQLAASQTSPVQTNPVLPELRPMSGPQPAFFGLGTVAEPDIVRVLPRWTAGVLSTGAQRPLDTPDLIRLGRMNLDGG